MTSSTSQPRIVILGGGFAGLNVARGLRHAPVSIVLVDRQNYHTFQPLLYQVATAELEPDNIAAPIRKILRNQSNVTVALGNVTDIDLDAKVVSFAGGELPYDVLVVATGVQQSYFGNDGFKPFAPGLKTVEDALEIRSRVLRVFEEAEWEADDDARRAKLTFVVVGGGPTGVELAGALVDLATNTLPKEFRNVDTRHARVILVEGGPQLLAAMPEDLRKRAQRKLENLGVEIRLTTRVDGVDSEGVTIGEEKIAAENVLWAAGVHGQSVAETLGVELDRAGRIVVGSDLAVPGHADVFVVGDAAHAMDAKTGKPVPGVAQGAIQTGSFVARIIKREAAGSKPQERPTFSYHDKGSMAMVGRGNAIAAIGKAHYGGLLGFLTWSLVHVMFLVGFGNKLVVMMGWLWNYLLHSRRARLIIGDPDIHIKRMRESDPRQSDPKLTHDAVGNRALEVESDFISNDKHQ